MIQGNPTEEKSASVAIIAHNEEANIGGLLDRVSKEQTPGIEISRIIVVSSGSTDKTDEIVTEFSQVDPRIALITQNQRQGKCAAINLFLKECPQNQLVVLLSGDILPEPGAIYRMLRPLLQDEVGMTGGHPVPINSKTRFFGFACHLIWEVHHRIALENPKLGEAVAFKKIVDAIPEDLAVDEAALEALIQHKELRLVYCPEAIIKNKGPENLHDFLKQRRRIQVGHLHLENKLGYKVSTFGLFPSIKALTACLEWKPKFLVWTILTCALVWWGRILGCLDYHLLGKRHSIWDIAQSTKGSLFKES